MSGSPSSFRGGHDLGVLCLDSIDTVLLSGGEAGDLCLWDQTSRELIKKITVPDSECTSICHSRSNDNVLYAAFGQQIRVYDRRNMDGALHVLEGNEDEVNQIKLNDQESYLAACDDSGNTKIYSIINNEYKVFKTLRHKHTNICSTLTFRPGKPHDLFTGGYDCHLIHWDFTRNKCLNMINFQEMIDSPQNGYLINPPFVNHMDLAPDGNLLVCGLCSGYVMIFDSSRKHLKPIHSFEAHALGVSHVHFYSPKKFMTGGNDAHVNLWDLSELNEEAAQQTNGNSDHTGVMPPLNCMHSAVIHSAKINSLLPIQNGENSLKLYVADPASDIWEYHIS